jgi:hypothetical protein
MTQTIIYAEDWAIKLQERLSEQNKWKEICKVEYTDTKVLHNPYMTDAAVQDGTRGSAYTHQEIVQTDESVTIDTFKILPQLIDRADAAQSTYSKQMDLASSQGVLLNEAIESALFATYGDLTTFDNTEIGGSAGNITVDPTNVDNIIRAMKRKIRKANGEDLMNRNGSFIVWRPEDFEMLEAFVQANGFNVADLALKNGIEQGFKYMNVEHYSSNKLTAGHLVGGVKKVWHLGICKSTYGQVVIDEEPATNSGAVSGTGIVSRVDFKSKAWTKMKPVLFNITVSAL